MADTVEQQSVASVCMDFVLKGYSLGTDSGDSLQAIEDPDGKIVAEILGESNQIVVGEALEIFRFRRLKQNNQQAF